jgi:23S rRNA pseudouridine2605 synthase
MIVECVESKICDLCLEKIFNFQLKCHRIIISIVEFMSFSPITEWRLNKYLATAGVASRRACDALIFDGKVTVNGQLTLLPQTKVTAKDQIAVGGRLLAPLEERVYYMLNKPNGYVCSRVGSARQRLVFELFDGADERLFTAGRLDKDTEGLLVVTNDGDFANRLIHPSSNIAKEYLVKVREEVTHEHLMAMSAGTLVEGVFVKPKKVVKVRRGTLRVTVYEGKKHEVRILAAAAGLTVYELTRIRLGGLTLGNLPVGAWRPLSERERIALFE